LAHELSQCCPVPHESSFTGGNKEVAMGSGAHHIQFSESDPSLVPDESIILVPSPSEAFNGKEIGLKSP
ncbi:MAG: hypothetical protein V3U52_07480, partial [Thermoplasmata archaeon]